MRNKLENIISSESTFSLDKKVQAEPNRGQIWGKGARIGINLKAEKNSIEKIEKIFIDLETGWLKKTSWKAKFVITKWETNREIWWFQLWEYIYFFRIQPESDFKKVLKMYL